MESTPPVQPTLVIVEDEEIISLFLREALCDAGFSVRAFSEATPAMRSITDPTVHAAVIDVGLPDMLGDEFTRQWHLHRPALPVILTTGYDEQHYQEAVATDPYVRVLGKPFDIPNLLVRLEEFGVYASRAHAIDSALP